MINNDLIKKFCNIKKQLESDFKEFIIQVIKDNGYAITITTYSVQMQTDDYEIVFHVVFVFNNINVDKTTFYIDSITAENVETMLREQIEGYFEDIMEDYSDD